MPLLAIILPFHTPDAQAHFSGKKCRGQENHAAYKNLADTSIAHCFFSAPVTPPATALPWEKTYLPLALSAQMMSNPAFGRQEGLTRHIN